MSACFGIEWTTYRRINEMIGQGYVVVQLSEPDRDKNALLHIAHDSGKFGIGEMEGRNERMFQP